MKSFVNSGQSKGQFMLLFSFTVLFIAYTAYSLPPRGRVRIENQTVVTDNGLPIRVGHGKFGGYGDVVFASLDDVNVKAILGIDCLEIGEIPLLCH